MGNIFENIVVVLIMLGIVWMIFGLFHVILHIFNVWDKIAIDIKLPKRKRFLTKVDPIYELCDSNFGGHVIKKWELDYADSIGLQFLMIYVPYPINLLRYKYVNKHLVWLPDNTNISKMTEELGEIFERMWAVKNAEFIEEKRKQKEYQDNLDRFNKVFNENFE